MLGTCDCCPEGVICPPFGSCYEITGYWNEAFNISLCSGCLESGTVWDGSDLIMISPCNWDYQNEDDQIGGVYHGMKGLHVRLESFEGWARLGIYMDVNNGAGCDGVTDIELGGLLWVGAIEGSSITGVYNRFGGCSSVPATLTIAACPP